MKKPLVAFVLLMLFASALLFAQGTSTAPGPPSPAMRVQHRVEFLTTLLNLNAQQQQQATTIFTNAANTEQSLHSSMKTAHDNLHTAIKANDANAIDQASTTIGNLTAQMTASEAKAHAAFYQILDSGQQTKMSTLQAQGPHFRTGGMGMGMGMGMGPQGGPPPQ